MSHAEQQRQAGSAWKFLLISFAVCYLAVLLLAPAAWAQSKSRVVLAPPPDQHLTLASFLEDLQPDELVPGADRFGEVTTEAPVVAPVYAGDELRGYAFLNSQYVNADGYSSKPIHIVVGIDLEGTITGLDLVFHSEPIVLIGISEQRVIDYMDPFIGYNPVKSMMAGEGLPDTDIVSSATVTVLVMGESVVRSTARVVQALGLIDTGSRGGEERIMDPEAGDIESWQALLDSGAVANRALTVGEVNEAFEETGNEAAIKRPEPGEPDDVFIELWTALVSQPSIGRSLLGDAEYEAIAKDLKPDQQAILVAGRGPYSFKGSGYVRGGIFDRIELIQGVETVRFRDFQHHRIGDIEADGAPHIQEISVFVLDEETNFDPADPWTLQLLVQRSVSALDKTFLPFALNYELPDAYTEVISRPQTDSDGADATTATQADSEDALTSTASSSVEATIQNSLSSEFEFSDLGKMEGSPLWVRIWKSKTAAIAGLGLMLIALTGIFFFQDRIVKYERTYDRIRTVYLTITLIWLGWIMTAQPSVVNVLTFTTALREGFSWEAFLIDPLIFMLWCAIAIALIFWGRGAFCGWLCPFGALQELTNKIAKALKIPQIKVPWGLHERLWAIKYIIFLALFAVSLGSLALAEVFAEVEPFKTAIVLRFMREWWFVLFAVLLVAASLFIERFFCRYLCPLGAALAIPARLRMFDWLKRYRECGNPCMHCFNECPVEAIHPEGHINPNECISCLHCQVLYHHDRKCPVMIKKRIHKEKRAAAAKKMPTVRPREVPNRTAKPTPLN